MKKFLFLFSCPRISRFVWRKDPEQVERSCANVESAEMSVEAMHENLGRQATRCAKQKIEEVV